VDYYLVAYASFGVIAASLNNNAMRIAQERKDGWIRQLRLTALPSYGYVTSKVCASLIAVIPAIVVTFALGTTQGVKLSADQWVSAFLVIWLGSLAFTALGIAIGYGVPQDAVQPVTLIIYVAGSFLGGQFFAVSGTLENDRQGAADLLGAPDRHRRGLQEPDPVERRGDPGRLGGRLRILAAVMYQKRAED
jgi:ABC-2 type transport system permease protein